MKNSDVLSTQENEQGDKNNSNNGFSVRATSIIYENPKAGKENRSFEDLADLNSDKYYRSKRRIQSQNPINNQKLSKFQSSRGVNTPIDNSLQESNYFQEIEIKSGIIKKEVHRKRKAVLVQNNLTPQNRLINMNTGITSSLRPNLQRTKSNYVF